MDDEFEEQYFDEQTVRKAYLNFVLQKQLLRDGYSKSHQVVN